jgi:hypothetical protein
MKGLEKFMWRLMEYLGQGKLSLREDGAIVYDAPCRCGDPYCGDELVLRPRPGTPCSSHHLPNNRATSFKRAISMSANKTARPKPIA